MPAFSSILSGILIGSLAGAGLGAATSAITGGKPAKGALFGAIGGGLTGGLTSAFGGFGGLLGGELGGAAAGAGEAALSAAAFTPELGLAGTGAEVAAAPALGSIAGAAPAELAAPLSSSGGLLEGAKSAMGTLNNFAKENPFLTKLGTSLATSAIQPQRPMPQMAQARPMEEDAVSNVPYAAYTKPVDFTTPKMDYTRLLGRT